MPSDRRHVESVRVWQFPGLGAYVSADVPGWLSGNVNFREVDDRSGKPVIVGIATPGTINAILEADPFDWFVCYPDHRLTLVKDDEFRKSYRTIQEIA